MEQGHIYHMCRWVEWREGARAGSYAGSSQDDAGFIHFSTAAQLPGSAARHRRGQPDLALLVVDPTPLGAALRWEPARDGTPFPHLYGPLPVTAVMAVYRLAPGPDGIHPLPRLSG